MDYLRFFKRKIFIGNQQNYIMNSRSERHKEYSDSRTDNKTTQPTSGGAVTANSSRCANCVEPPRPQQWGSDLPFWACRPCGPAGWLALLLTKAGDVETNPGPTTLNKKVWICHICHKQINVRKQISIRCNRIEHWVHLRCAGIRQAQYTDTWTCIYTENPVSHLTQT